jgi:hypothetical protein
MSAPKSFIAATYYISQENADTDREIIHIATVHKHIPLFIRNGRQEPSERHTCTNVSPRVTGGMGFHLELQYIRRIAVKRQPEIFHMRITECLPNAAIKLH